MTHKQWLITYLNIEKLRCIRYCHINAVWQTPPTHNGLKQSVAIELILPWVVCTALPVSTKPAHRHSGTVLPADPGWPWPRQLWVLSSASWVSFSGRFAWAYPSHSSVKKQLREQAWLYSEFMSLWMTYLPTSYLSVWVTQLSPKSEWKAIIKSHGYRKVVVVKTWYQECNQSSNKENTSKYAERKIGALKAN